MDDILCLPIKIFTSDVIKESLSMDKLQYSTYRTNTLIVRTLIYDYTTICAYKYISDNIYNEYTTSNYGYILIDGECDAMELESAIEGSIRNTFSAKKLLEILLPSQLDILDIGADSCRYYTLKRLHKYANQLIEMRKIDLFNLKINNLHGHIVNDDCTDLRQLTSLIKYRIFDYNGCTHYYLIIRTAIKTTALYFYRSMFNKKNKITGADLRYDHFSRSLLYTNKPLFDVDLFMLAPSDYISTIDKIADLPKNNHYRIFKEYNSNNTIYDYVSAFTSNV